MSLEHERIQELEQIHLSVILSEKHIAIPSGVAFLFSGGFLKLSYTDLKNEYIRAIGSPNNALSDALLSQFQMNLSQRYQLALAKMRNYKTQKPFPFSTAATVQYYYYPVGMVNFESAQITIGSFNYPLEPINSQRSWDALNAIQIQPSAIPQFIFPRRDDFGIWPVPQAIYSGTMNYHYRDHSLLVDDYTTGTIALTNGSATLTGTGTTFTTGMIGRWLQITDVTNPQYGYWYRIGGFTSTTVMALDTTYQGTTTSGVTYRIAQVPEFPDEGHICLLHGVLADFYGNSRDDADRAIQFENQFWTGDKANPSRDEGSDQIVGGVIGICNRYSDRNDERLVNRKPKLYPLPFKAFAYSIS